MTTYRGLRAATVAATGLILLAACAGQNAGAGSPSPSSASPALPRGDADDLVLRVESVGGFVPADRRVGEEPTISIYADGRAVFPGPVIAIFPGPALPNWQVGMLSPAQLSSLGAKAAAAGVVAGTDFGTPGVADAPATRVTVGDVSVRAEALQEAREDDAQLTAAQQQARKKLLAFVNELNDLTAGLTPVAYRPTTLAGIVQPYQNDGDNSLPLPEKIAWPGPALPGEKILEGTEITCVLAMGPQLDAVWQAASKANTRTRWTSAGKTWSVRFRPLLPDETTCADLKGEQ